MSKMLIFALLLLGCNSNKTIQVTATGNNGDGTVNIEFIKNGETFSMFHISVDSLLTFIRSNNLEK